MVQLVDRIDALLEQESDEFVVAELLAKKSAYLGRIGQADKARELIQFVRQKFNDGRSGRVTCFVLIAEGVLLHHSFQSNEALDKFARASLLAHGLRQADLIGICAAWKGFAEFDLSRFESMQRSLLLIRDLGLEEDHAVMSRLATTVMTGGLLLGERQFSQKWFHVGHNHAVAEGDLACIDALLFNKAVFGLARQRVAWCLAGVDASWAKVIRAELDSARNLQNLVGISSLKDHVDLCVARLDLVEGRNRDSFERLRKLQSVDRFSKKHVNELALHIDTLYVQSQLEIPFDLAKQLQEMDLRQVSSLDPDERLVAMTTLDKLSAMCPDKASAPSFKAEIAITTAEYLAFEQQIRTAFQPWLLP